MSYNDGSVWNCGNRMWYLQVRKMWRTVTEAGPKSSVAASRGDLEVRGKWETTYLDSQKTKCQRCQYSDWLKLITFPNDVPASANIPIVMGILTYALFVYFNTGDSDSITVISREQLSSVASSYPCEPWWLSWHWIHYMKWIPQKPESIVYLIFFPSLSHKYLYLTWRLRNT